MRSEAHEIPSNPAAPHLPDLREMILLEVPQGVKVSPAGIDFTLFMLT